MAATWQGTSLETVRDNESSSKDQKTQGGKDFVDIENAPAELISGRVYQ